MRTKNTDTRSLRLHHDAVNSPQASVPCPPLAPVMLYGAHAVGLSIAAHLIHSHLDSFEMLLLKDNLDKARMHEVKMAAARLSSLLESLAGEISTSGIQRDATYLENLREAMKCGEYAPIEQLAEFHRLWRERIDFPAQKYLTGELVIA